MSWWLFKSSAAELGSNSCGAVTHLRERTISDSVWTARLFHPSGSSGLSFYNPPLSLGKHGRVEGADYTLTGEPEWWSPPELALIQRLLSVDPLGRAEPPLVSTVKSSPPLGWNPFRHASNCLDPEEYEYTPPSATFVNLVYCLHPLAYSVI